MYEPGKLDVGDVSARAIDALKIPNCLGAAERSAHRYDQLWSVKHTLKDISRPEIRPVFVVSTHSGTTGGIQSSERENIHHCADRIPP
jgi:hypothetical protein